tara:strand:+ start:39919 stop:40107 length:189 start_codon:yes stop_codon:yes gene_type:complete
MAKMLVDHRGFAEPLCDFCKTADCDNPIETRKVSILGITKSKKVYVRNDEATFVVACEGFIK